VSVALYGHFRGEASFAQVTRGMQRALRRADMLAGVVGIDLEDVDDAEAVTAPVSLNCGDPRALLMAHRLGDHREHWLLLAPNGETIADGFVRAMTEPSEVCPRGLLDGGLIAPSEWGAAVLQRYFPRREVIVARHGVTPEVHYVREAQRERARRQYDDGLFYCVHFLSGETERKGTAVLMEAWHRLKHKRLLPRKAALILVAPPPETSRLRWKALKLGLDADDGGDDLLIVPGFSLGQAEVVETYYSAAHIVCQPSRGEGFGLVPLEARACGVPVVATGCTGHSEHMPDLAGPALSGCVRVKTGPSEPMDDFPGSMAPSVRVEDVASALQTAYEDWHRIEQAARGLAEHIQAEWTWERGAERALVRLKERGEQNVR